MDHREPAPVGVSRVLVVGSPAACAWWLDLDLGPGLMIEPCQEGATALRLVAAGDIDALVATGQATSGLLSIAKERDPDCLRILEIDDTAPGSYLAAINRGVVDRLWVRGDPEERAVELLHDAAEEALLRRHNRALLDELAQRNVELLDFTANLERLVEERTVHLREAHQRLQTQQQALLRLETHGVLTHLARGLAHELNNPLAAILGFAQRLRKTSTDDEVRRRLQVILDEVERCRQLVDQIRRLAAPLDEGVAAVRPQEALERALSRHRQAGKRVPDVSVIEPLPQVLAAPEALARVLEEGLDNAIQAGGTVAILAGGMDGPMVRLTLANNGATPSVEEAFNATKPFFTTRATQGAQGLGLAVAAGLLREQDGHLELVPGRSGGAVLVLHLPAAEAPVVGPAPTGLILVVDDQPLVAELLAEVVRDLGFPVEVAGDVRTALHLVEERTVAAILTDLHLPDGTGRELAEAATRSAPRLAGRVAVITGDPDSVRADLPILAKPFRAEQVEALLRRLCGS